MACAAQVRIIQLAYQSDSRLIPNWSPPCGLEAPFCHGKVGLKGTCALAAWGMVR